MLFELKNQNDLRYFELTKDILNTKKEKIEVS